MVSPSAIVSVVPLWRLLTFTFYRALVDQWPYFFAVALAGPFEGTKVAVLENEPLVI